MVESFHIRFVERKDEEERIFQPGRILGASNPTACNTCHQQLPSESQLISHPVRDLKKEDEVTVNSTPGPLEASQTPVDQILLVDPELGPVEVEQTLAKKATTIETVLDDDDPLLTKTK